MLATSLALTAPLFAQMGGGMMGDRSAMGSGMMGGQQGMGGVLPQRGEAPSPGARQISGVMHDMADQLMQFARQISKGEMAAATRQRTHDQMSELAMMIERLSHMVGQDTSMHPEMSRQIHEMQQRMQQIRQASDVK